ncbi:MAG: hypothetical protein MPJ52_05470, partial [Alphaproteobacteria bacterium]|nr:hypothetical protein [Alphaproteobacteria bacterium]
MVFQVFVKLASGEEFRMNLPLEGSLGAQFSCCLRRLREENPDFFSGVVFHQFDGSGEVVVAGHDHGRIEAVQVRVIDQVRREVDVRLFFPIPLPHFLEEALYDFEVVDGIEGAPVDLLMRSFVRSVLGTPHEGRGEVFDAGDFAVVWQQFLAECFAVEPAVRGISQAS